MGLWKAVVSQFTRPTGFWGRVAGFIMAHRPSNRIRNFWTVDLLDVRPGQNVLEVGFGPGIALEYLLNREPGATVWGIDHSGEMLRMASARNRRAIQEGRLTLLPVAAEALNGSLPPMDRLFAVNSLHLWREKSAGLKALYAALKPGGKAAFTFQPRNRGATDDDAFKTADKLSSLLQEAGFTRLRREVKKLNPVAICLVAEKPEEQQQ